MSNTMVEVKNPYGVCEKHLRKRPSMCPFCRIAELEAAVREAMRLLDNYGQLEESVRHQLASTKEAYLVLASEQ